MKKLNELANQIYNHYRHFYKTDDDIAFQVEHLKSEVAELGEAIEKDKDASWADCERHGLGNSEYLCLKNTIQDELADILIMALALCSTYMMTASMFDIEWWINKKMEYNKTRNYHKESSHDES